MPVIPTGFGQVNWILGGAGLPTGAEVTCGVNIGGFAGTATDAADALATVFVDNILPRIVSSVQLAQTLVKFGPTATGPSGTSSTGGTGSAGGAGASSAVSALVHKNTSFGGRAGKGRMYIPGLQESDVSNAGVIDSGAAGAWATSLGAMLSDMFTADLPAVLLHGVGSPISAPTTITSFSLDPTVATQRRRQRR